MPGSIRMMTAPILKSAKVSVINSTEGLTISITRSPFVKPRSIKFRANQFVKLSISLNVQDLYPFPFLHTIPFRSGYIAAILGRVSAIL